MRRAYRFAVTVYIEGDDRDDLPTFAEMTDQIADCIHDERDHQLEVTVRPIETEDYEDDQLPTQGADCQGKERYH